MFLALAILLGITTAICGIQWLAYYISTTTLLWYLEEHGYPKPSDEELRRGAQWVVRHMLKDLLGKHP